MGGTRYGAGRPATHVKAEHCRRIDVRRWHREGILRAGQAGAWQWLDSYTGEPRAAISHRSDGAAVTLSYAIDGVPAEQTIGLRRSDCNFGGSRPWFICPIRGESVAVLFLRRGRFACRHCQRIAYASQSDDACGRAWRAQSKAECKLDDSWARPKGMHRETHEKLKARIESCEGKRENEIARFVASFARRYPGLAL